MIAIVGLIVLAVVILVVLAYQQGVAVGKELGAKEERAKYVDEVKVVTKETVV